MSDGRWVWCPPGWRVVPEEMTGEMEMAFWGDTGEGTWTNSDWRRAVAAAPEPPSGWQYGFIPVSGLCLVAYNLRAIGQEWNILTGRNDEGEVEDSEMWWTPLPPPPEEQT